MVSIGKSMAKAKNIKCCPYRQTSYWKILYNHKLNKSRPVVNAGRFQNIKSFPKDFKYHLPTGWWKSRPEQIRTAWQTRPTGRAMEPLFGWFCFQNHNVIFWSGNEEAVPLAEAQKQFPIFEALCGLVKSFKFDTPPVTMLNSFRVHKNCEGLFFLNVRNLRKDWTFMVGV